MANSEDEHWPVLIVEDDQPTAELEAKVLLRAGKTSCIVSRVDDAIAELSRRRFSAVLLDYLLADENGWRVLEAAQKANPPIPVFIVTGKGNESVAAEALRRGAADYIIKNGEYWEQLPNIVERIIQAADAERLRKFLASMLESSDDAIVGVTLQGTITNWNSGATKIFGKTAAESKGQSIFEFIAPDRRRRLFDAFDRARSGQRENFESLGLLADGGFIHISISVTPVLDESGKASSVSLVARDITERKRAEEQLHRAEFHLRQLQKLDALRGIAGGVAHEFNNLLTVIIARTQLIKARVPSDSPFWNELSSIIETGERAAAVTRHLLAFSRQQTLSPKVVSLNEILLATKKLLKKTLGDKISLEVALSPDPVNVFADPIRIEEVLLNLTTNARDAMPEGGKFTIETANVFRSEEFAATHEGFKPGEYVLLALSDTGCGMDQATQARIFEPFFTTKGRAQRAGLGLCVVYGTIKQSEGFIYVNSQPNNGTRIEIYLKRAEAVKPKETISPVLPAPAAQKTILIVEDELAVLELVKDILDESGYVLLTASSPAEAITIAEQNRGHIDLLLTDVLMPGMNGQELAARLSSQDRKMRVLFMSGYLESHMDFAASGNVAFIVKPFSPANLRRKVKEVLSLPNGNKG